MHIKKTKYQFMAGEPQLGTVTEYDLIAENSEVQAFILDQVMECGELDPTYEFEDNGMVLIVDPKEWLDYDAVTDFLAAVYPDDIDRELLEAYACIDKEK